MSDKYNSLKIDLSVESSYQMLVEPRNKECGKRGAVEYVVVDSKSVKHGNLKKDCPLIYDNEEFYVLNDNTVDDTWGGQTTTGIFTINTLETPDKLRKILDDNKEKEQLQRAIEALDDSGDTPAGKSLTSYPFNLIVSDDNRLVKLQITLNDFNEEAAGVSEDEFIESVSSSVFNLLKDDKSDAFYFNATVDEFMLDSDHEIKLNAISVINCHNGEGQLFGKFALTYLNADDDSEYNVPDDANIDGAAKIAFG